MATEKDKETRKGLAHKLLIGIAMLIIALTLYAAGRNFVHAFRIRRQIRMLQHEEQIYRKEIERDSILLERLKQDDYLEQYAREHYFMLRKGEKLYIVK